VQYVGDTGRGVRGVRCGSERVRGHACAILTVGTTGPGMVRFPVSRCCQEGGLSSCAPISLIGVRRSLLVRGVVPLGLSSGLLVYVFGTLRCAWLLKLGWVIDLLIPLYQVSWGNPRYTCLRRVPVVPMAQLGVQILVDFMPYGPYTCIHEIEMDPVFFRFTFESIETLDFDDPPPPTQPSPKLSMMPPITMGLSRLPYES
jgi:hypothetical protein